MITHSLFKFDFEPEAIFRLGFGGALELVSPSDTSAIVSQGDDALAELACAEEHIECKDFPRAFNSLGRAMTSVANNLGADHWLIAVIGYDRARILAKLGEENEARRHAYLAALAAEDHLPDHPWLSYIIGQRPVPLMLHELPVEDITTPLFEFDRRHEAAVPLGFESALSQVATRQARALETQAARALECLVSAERLHNKGDARDARMYLQAARSMIIKAWGTGSWLEAVIVYDMARMSMRLGDQVQAQRLADEAADMAAPLLGQHSWLVYVVSAGRPGELEDEYADDDMHGPGRKPYGSRY